MKMRNSRATPLEVLVFLLGIVVGWQWGYFWADARRQIRENRMSEFKVGDRVRVKKDAGWFDLENRPGVLIESDNEMYLHLKLDRPPDGDYRGYFPVRPDEIEPLDG